MARKRTTEIVKEAFAKKGYILLDEYTNAHKPLKFICNKGHYHQIAWISFHNGGGCGICAGKFVPPDLVKKTFEQEGYTLLSEYVRNTIPLKFICPNNHHHQITWKNFRRGYRCAVCSGNYMSSEYVKEAFEKEGYTLLSEYINNSARLKFICSKGHHHQIAWSNFQQGQRCGKCNSENFYSNYTNRITTRITSSISADLKRMGSALAWDYYYSMDQIKLIAGAIEHIYDSCPRGFVVDHIVPISYFKLCSEVELMACWSPKNLRHLDALANLKRKNIMTQEEIGFMTKNHPDIVNTVTRSSYAHLFMT